MFTENLVVLKQFHYIFKLSDLNSTKLTVFFLILKQFRTNCTINSMDVLLK